MVLSLIEILIPSTCLKAKETEQQVEQLAAALWQVGINGHETIGIHADLSKESVLLLFAAIKMGLKAALCPVREPISVLSACLKTLGIKKLISSRDHPSLASIASRYWTVSDLLKVKANTPLAAVAKSYQFSSIIRTSGTTGQPKNAMIGERQHWASAKSVSDYFALTDKDCLALSLPLYHVSGLAILFRALQSKARVFVAESQKDLLWGLSLKQITHISLVPAQLKRLLDEGANLAHLKAVVIGGDALTLQLRQRALQCGLPLFESYGLTETASMVWVKNSQAQQGQLLPHATMSFAKDGEILVGGDSLFDGYVGQNGQIEPLAKPFFPTGDVNDSHRFDQLQLVCRKNNRIISGGENIQAEEIERVLEEHPAIAQSVVVAFSDEVFGARPCAYIKWINKPLPDAMLNSYLRLKLAAYKIPDRFLTWPSDIAVGLKKPRRVFSELIHSSLADKSSDKA